MASFYELDADYLELKAMLEVAETEEDIKAITDTLEMLDVSIKEKLENTAKFIKNIESDIEGARKESKRLSDYAKMRENFVKKLKENLELAMKSKGDDKLKVGVFSCGYRKSESVVVDNLDDIPVDYIKTEVKADKIEIKKALKSGKVITGARLQTNMNFYIK